LSGVQNGFRSVRFTGDIQLLGFFKALKTYVDRFCGWYHGVGFGGLLQDCVLGDTRAVDIQRLILTTRRVDKSMTRVGAPPNGSHCDNNGK
jgi:hypothetical protein